MAKTEAKKVRLIRGASFVVPGKKFVPGVSEVVTDPKILEACKRSQQFKIDDADSDGEDLDAETPVETEEGEESMPKKRKGKKK